MHRHSLYHIQTHSLLPLPVPGPSSASHRSPSLSSPSPASPSARQPASSRPLSPRLRQSQLGDSTHESGSSGTYLPIANEKADVAVGNMSLTDIPIDSHTYRQPPASTHSAATMQMSHQNTHPVSLGPYSPRSPRPHMSGSLPAVPLPSSYSPSGRSQRYVRPRGLRIINLLKSWTPILAYAGTSLGFVVAIAFWKTEVFEGLDNLSTWLQDDSHYGYAVLFFLIFITTFPPLPLYSTLITLSGYTFGPWIGAVISYFAALSGALFVFFLARTPHLPLASWITHWLQLNPALFRVVRAIEKRPKLLFLIRLAPYPYNVMNALLAAAPTLTGWTYGLCTALSLFKVIIHTSIGASIHSFKDYHVKPSTPSDGTTGGSDGSSSADTQGEGSTARTWTIVGVALCVVIFLYLSYVARRAVDDELDDDYDVSSAAMAGRDAEENVAFLSESTPTPFEEVEEELVHVRRHGHVDAHCHSHAFNGKLREDDLEMITDADRGVDERWI